MRALYWQPSVLLLLLAGLGGCATVTAPPPSAASAPSAPTAIELAEVPFHPQREHQCGPAALATVLGWSGVDVAPDQLSSKLYIPAREGTLQHELVAQTRRHERLAYPLTPEPAAILAELAAGNPVLVLQNLGLSWLPYWHYAVVVGYEPERDRFILRSGTQERHLSRRSTFLRTWSRAGNWALVVTPPGEIPASAEPAPYLRVVLDLERSGAQAAALAGYRAGVERWPHDAGLALGLGNAYYAAGRPERAAQVFRAATERGAASGLIYHNLAYVLTELGEREAALAAAERAVAAGGTHAPEFRRTLRKIRAGHP